jgi:hypothetical protein
MASRTYNANPFFSSAFFAPSIGEKIDNATAQAQAKAEELKVKGEKMAGVYGDKAYNKLQDAKEIVKDTASVNPTGVDLYARFVERACGGLASGMSPKADANTVCCPACDCQVRPCRCPWLCHHPR